MNKIFLHFTVAGLLVCLTVFFITGCTKFVQVGTAPNQLLNQTVFGSDATATSAVTGMYTRMTSGNGFASGGPYSTTVLSGLSSDEFINFSSDIGPSEFATNNLLATNGNLQMQWSDAFQFVFTANSIIEGLNSSSSVSTAVKNQLIGEAKFVRAFCYFYLTNAFGDVPLYLSTSYQKNATSSKTASSLVYAQIISDLQDAQNLLLDDYSASNGQRIRPNKGAATALLARAYLYTGNWTAAETEATKLINNTAQYNLLPDLNKVFLANSQEAIWQLLPVSPNINTQEGQVFILTADPVIVSMSDNLKNAFEPNDNRAAQWIGSYTDGASTWYFPYKYKVKTGSNLTEYSMVLRLAEQYLIRAEARANLDNVPGSQADLNAIRSRAGLTATAGNDKTSLLNAITHERQVELFSEWGHRWFDLKRTQQADAILGPIKSPGWQSTDTLYPIPHAEIQNNPLIIQNAGY